MVLTRKEGNVAFNHILDIVLGRGDGTPLKSALDEEGIDDIFALFNLTDNDIDSPKYKNKDNDNVITPIWVIGCNLLRS